MAGYHLHPNKFLYVNLGVNEFLVYITDIDLHKCLFLPSSEIMTFQRSHLHLFGYVVWSLSEWMTSPHDGARFRIVRLPLSYYVAETVIFSTFFDAESATTSHSNYWPKKVAWSACYGHIWLLMRPTTLSGGYGRSSVFSASNETLLTASAKAFGVLRLLCKVPFDAMPQVVSSLVKWWQFAKQ